MYEIMSCFITGSHIWIWKPIKFFWDVTFWQTIWKLFRFKWQLQNIYVSIISYFHKNVTFFKIKCNHPQRPRRGCGHGETSKHLVSLWSHECALYRTSSLTTVTCKVSKKFTKRECPLQRKNLHSWVSGGSVFIYWYISASKLNNIFHMPLTWQTSKRAYKEHDFI